MGGSLVLNSLGSRYSQLCSLLVEMQGCGSSSGCSNSSGSSNISSNKGEGSTALEKCTAATAADVSVASNVASDYSSNSNSCSWVVQEDIPVLFELDAAVIDHNSR